MRAIQLVNATQECAGCSFTLTGKVGAIDTPIADHPGEDRQHLVIVAALLDDLADQRSVVVFAIAGECVEEPTTGCRTQQKPSQRQWSNPDRLPASVDERSKEEQAIGQDKEQEPFSAFREKGQPQVECKANTRG